MSDEEHVERVRRGLTRLERSRRWFILLYVILSAAFVWILVKFCTLLAAILQPPNNAAPGFLGFGLGMVFGIGTGMLAFKIGHGLGSVLFSRRTDRLLIQYYDANYARSKGAEEDLDVAKLRRSRASTRAADRA